MREGGAFARPHASEQFAVPRAAEDLPFDGERLTGAVGGQVELEHLHRYSLARDLCIGRDVLDVGSGEGYGAAILAGVARQVTGVELDAAAVQHAQRHHARPNLRFLQGDALALPLQQHAVDVVVCFEVLEHLTGQEALLAEIRRVLRPGGLLVISTPDRLVYSAPGREPNPHHLRELTEAEFDALLRQAFGQVALLRQRAAVGSLIAGEGPARWRSFERRRADRIEASDGLARADYLIALASDHALPPFGSSACVAPIPVDEALAVPALRRELDRARAALAESEARREALLRSLSWRLTAPFRASARLIVRGRAAVGARLGASRGG